MAQTQEYLKEYIRLMGDEDLQAVQPVKTSQIAAAAVAPANEVPTTNLTTIRFQNQPSTTTDIDRVSVTKSHKPTQPLSSRTNRPNVGYSSQVNQGKPTYYDKTMG
ncbi:hypothetical protein FNV43_RR13619 [Rhamnella rubrinervis]|uniref:Uncharacterized protein n=1 Tax=Rhamnella rubrinervis TaxID=2594499 RepID=A0A8K0MEJ4_9ROSA|nr:hypothetical protein FNV43_RR13619 [Rhamnella rubrinervis]